MGYIIFVRAQVEPQYFGSGAINPGPAPDYPAGSALVYSPSDLNIYSANSADRLELLSSPEGTASGPEIFAAFPKIQLCKEKEIRAESGRLMNRMADPYSKEEQDTWMLQAGQAKAWLADNTAPCVMVRGMAAERGITMVDMVGRILGNADAFEPYLGYVLGYQQKLIDRIYAATDFDEMRAISW